MTDRFNMKVGDTKLFYPKFCFDCQLNHVSDVKLNPCPHCGSGKVVNHERKIYDNEMRMRKSC